MGITPLMLWLACLIAIRNQRILTAWDKRQPDNAAASPQQPRARKRRRELAGAPAAPP